MKFKGGILSILIVLIYGLKEMLIAKFMYMLFVTQSYVINNMTLCHS